MLARWFDLQGSGVYRADASFYGQGPTAEHQLDRCSYITTIRDLQNEPGEFAELFAEPSVGQPVDAMVASFATTTTLGPDEQSLGDQVISEPEEQISAIRKEILDCWREGLSSGWVEGNSEITAFNVSLSSLTDSPHTRELADNLTREADAHGLDTLVVLSRGTLRLFPWESAGLSNGERLGERLAVVHVPTLAALPTSSIERLDGTLTYAAATPGADIGVDIGRAALSALDGEPQGPMGRIEFEYASVTHGVLRIFAHAMNNPFLASRSRLYLNEAQHEKFAYNAHEISSLDLRGCRRVELWACESGFTEDMLGRFLDQEEPLGLGSFFHLAGVDVVVGSWWSQPADSAALIAAGFASRVRSAERARDDSRALASAIRSYRDAVAERGPFEEAAVRAIREAIDYGHERVRGRAYRAAWETAYHEITGEHAVLPFAVWCDLDESDRHLGQRLVEMEPGSRDEAIRKLASELTAPLREHWRWAGWRISTRAKDVV